MSGSYSGGDCGSVGEGDGDGAPREPSSRNFGGPSGGLLYEEAPGFGHSSEPTPSPLFSDGLDRPSGGPSGRFSEPSLGPRAGARSAKDLFKSPRESPEVIAGSPRELTVSVFPAREFGWPSGGPQAEAEPEATPRDATTSPFPVRRDNTPQGELPSVFTSPSGESASSPFVSEGSCMPLSGPPSLSSHAIRKLAESPDAPAGKSCRPGDGVHLGALDRLTDGPAVSPISSEEARDGLLPGEPAPIAATTSRGSVETILPVGDFSPNLDGPIPPTGCSAIPPNPTACGRPGEVFCSPPNVSRPAFRGTPGASDSPCRLPPSSALAGLDDDEPPKPSDSIALAMPKDFAADVFSALPCSRSPIGRSRTPSRPAEKTSPVGDRLSPRNEAANAGSTVEASTSKKGGPDTEHENNRVGGEEREGGVEGGTQGEDGSMEKAEADEFGGEESDDREARPHAGARSAGDLTQGENGSRTVFRASTEKAQEEGHNHRIKGHEGEENEGREDPADNWEVNGVSYTSDGAGVAPPGGDGGSDDHGGQGQDRRAERKSGGSSRDEGGAYSERSLGETNKERKPLSPVEKLALVNLSWDAFVLQLSELVSNKCQTNRPKSHKGASGDLPSNRVALGSSAASPLVSGGGRTSDDAPVVTREDKKGVPPEDFPNHKHDAEDDNSARGSYDEQAATETEKNGGRVGTRQVESNNDAFSQISSAVVDNDESGARKEAVVCESAVLAADTEFGSKHHSDDASPGDVRNTTGNIHVGPPDFATLSIRTGSASSTSSTSAGEEDARGGGEGAREKEIGEYGGALVPGRGRSSEDGGGGEGLTGENGVPCPVAYPANGASTWTGVKTKPAPLSNGTTPPDSGPKDLATAVGTQLGMGGREYSDNRAEDGGAKRKCHLEVASVITDRTLAGRKAGEPKERAYLGGVNEGDDGSEPSDPCAGKEATRLIPQRAHSHCTDQGSAAVSVFAEAVDQGPASNETKTNSETEGVGEGKKKKEVFPLPEGYLAAPTVHPVLISNSTREDPFTATPTFEGPINSGETSLFDISDGPESSTGTLTETEGSPGKSLHSNTPGDGRGSGRSEPASADCTVAVLVLAGCGQGEEQTSSAKEDHGGVDDKEINQPMGTKVGESTPWADVRRADGGASQSGEPTPSMSSLGIIFSDDYPTSNDSAERHGGSLDASNTYSTESDQRQSNGFLVTNADVRSVDEETVGRPARLQETGAGMRTHEGVETCSRGVATDGEPRTRNKACQTRW